MGTRPISLLVLQPTPYCNLDCTYCYLPHRSDRRAMSDATLDALAMRVIGSDLAAPRISVIWHCGEPMTLRPAWYEAAFSRLAARADGRVIEHCFQTNAIGVDDAWLSLWASWGVRIGVSLDGPADLHDRHRVTRGGRGSFALTMRGVERLQAAGHPFHIITVLTAESLDDPDRLLDFYLAHGLRDVGFNIEEEEDAHTCSSLRGADMATRYGRFLARFTERIRDLPEPFACREIDGVRWLAGASPEQRRHNPQVNPLEIVSISVDGTLSTFSPELLGVAAPEFGDFAFGNVHADGPETMLEHPAFLRTYAEISAGVEACRLNCSYFDICGGAAPANKFFELGSFRGTETLYCRLARQTAVEAILGALEDHVVA
jgi:uncharacterized protein